MLFRCADPKSQNHANKAIKHWSKATGRLVTQFNRLQKIAATCDSRPEGAVVPLPLDPKKITSMDLADALWDDSDLVDPGEWKGQPPPLWLGNIWIRAGIRAEQDVTNCEVELVRCRAGVSNLRTWFAEEHTALVLVLQDQPGMLIALLCISHSGSNTMSA